MLTEQVVDTSESWSSAAGIVGFPNHTDPSDAVVDRIILEPSKCQDQPKRFSVDSCHPRFRWDVQCLLESKLRCELDDKEYDKCYDYECDEFAHEVTHTERSEHY